MRITTIGRGTVGGTLATLWRAAGHDVIELGRDGGDATGSDAVVLAVPYSVVPDALGRHRDHRPSGHDATNRLGGESAPPDTSRPPTTCRPTRAGPSGGDDDGGALAGEEPGMAPYAGRMGFARAAVSWAGDGIRVNGIAPGGTATDIMLEWYAATPGVIEGNNAATPLGRMAEPIEVAEVAVDRTGPQERRCSRRTLARGP